MILFVDHYDSFTNNLTSWFLSENINIQVISFDKLETMTSFKDIDAIIFSPGPGHPSEYKKSINFYHKIPHAIPFLGVCLGHQILLHAEGGVITQIEEKPIHGRQILIKQNLPSKYFENNVLNQKFVFYNSLGCKTNDPVFSKSMLALADEKGFVLATEHKMFPRIGVQFHPESFASPGGAAVLKSFLRLISC
ncbi:aminodeoxychorismate/anthranilate synthase component II [Silvanigrella aquatica]|uniref:Glutamine amidotransferase domain-containing protein n=1 Tax=Silvanigrella aquatica TaxID=1915309 RepID=A0A1L4CXW1_9BACT|nr:aminodeoxychorismate/anthranilate synthase component II [Silvanigrella aquatica]APJ02792.1 hypothetical protein AXG55_02170 [Silvanigrella aquatica]